MGKAEPVGKGQVIKESIPGAKAKEFNLWPWSPQETVLLSIQSKLTITFTPGSYFDTQCKSNKSIENIAQRTCALDVELAVTSKSCQCPGMEPFSGKLRFLVRLKCSFSLSRFLCLSGHEFNDLTSFMNQALIITSVILSVFLSSLDTFVWKLCIFSFHCRECRYNVYSTKYLYIS